MLTISKTIVRQQLLALHCALRQIAPIFRTVGRLGVPVIICGRSADYRPQKIYHEACLRVSLARRTTTRIIETTRLQQSKPPPLSGRIFNFLMAGPSTWPRREWLIRRLKTEQVRQNWSVHDEKALSPLFQSGSISGHHRHRERRCFDGIHSRPRPSSVSLSFRYTFQMILYRFHWGKRGAPTLYHLITDRTRIGSSDDEILTWKLKAPFTSHLPAQCSFAYQWKIAARVFFYCLRRFHFEYTSFLPSIANEYYTVFHGAKQRWKKISDGSYIHWNQLI